MSKNNKVTLRNVVSSLILQAVNIVSNFIIPRLIIASFGSEMNGLAASLTQFLNVVSLFEGGLNGVVMASLYKPLYDKDYQKVGSIIKTSIRFFRKISLAYALYAALVAIICPFIIKTPYSFSFVSSLALIISVRLFSQYCLSMAYKNLLNADKKVYVVSLVQIFLTIADTVLAVLVCTLAPSVHLLKIASALVFMVQPIFLSHYVKKNYVLSSGVAAQPDNNLARDRWNGFAITLAAFVHNNTDIAIISVFISLSEASVYSVYALVAAGLKQITFSMWNAFTPMVGNLYASGDKNKLNAKFDTLEFINMIITFALFSIGGLLITPFVNIYTQGANDVSYARPIFGILLLLAEGIYILRSPYVTLASSANKFKDMTPHAIVEAVINIVLSIILAPLLGINGIAIGTVIAMSYRTIYHIVYLRKNLINRPILKFVKRFIVFAAFTGLAVLTSTIITTSGIVSLLDWVKYAAIYAGVFFACYIVMSLLFFRNELKAIAKYIKR